MRNKALIEAIQQSLEEHELYSPCVYPEPEQGELEQEMAWLLAEQYRGRARKLVIVR